MAELSIKIKVLPKSPEEDMENLKEDLKKSLEEAGAIEISNTEEEPVAFGLKALIITMVWSEDKEMDIIEETIGKNEKVSSTEILNISRTMT